MKKLLLIAVLSFTVGCSSDSGSGDETISTLSDVAGQWKLQSTVANGSNTNIATECDLQFGQFSFGGSAVEKRGSNGATCTEQTFTYSDYNVVEGQLRMTRNNVEYRYNVTKNGNTLSLTRFYSKAADSDPIIVPTAEQKTSKYLKQ